MTRIIFYSWQSDLPNATNRGFIFKALQQAVSAITGDTSIDVEPVLDRDTAGVAGSPNIAQTILDKIARADALVLDVSLITPEGSDKHCPNPNVLLELGFAVGTLGWPRIIMVMNTAFGEPSDLPFDLRGHRVLKYSLAKSSETKSEQRKILSKRLRKELQIVLENPHSTSTVTSVQTLAEQVLQSIEARAPDRAPRIRRLMKHICGELVRIEPDLSGSAPKFEKLKTSLDKSIPFVATYGGISSRASEMRDNHSLSELYRCIGLVAARFQSRSLGSVYTHQFDYWRFIGHELAVMFTSYMIRERMWKELGRILNQDLILEYDNGERSSEPFTCLWSSVKLCNREGRKRRRASYRADLLNERHSSEPLSTLGGFNAFMDADYFLFLRSELPRGDEWKWPLWIPESAILQSFPAVYLVEAERTEVAQNLAVAIGVDGPETLRRRLHEQHRLLGRCFPRAGWPVGPFMQTMEIIAKLGSR